MRIHHWLTAGYVAISLLALALIPLSAAGWIAPDPLSVVPAMLLAMPWIYGLLALGASESAALNIALIAMAIALNAGLIWLIGSYLSRRRDRRRLARATPAGPASGIARKR